MPEKTYEKNQEPGLGTCVILRFTSHSDDHRQKIFAELEKFLDEKFQNDEHSD